MKRFWIAILLLAAVGGTAAAQTPPQTPLAPSLLLAHVRVADMGRSERFYRDVFGMTVTNPVSPREHILRFPGQGSVSAGIALLTAGDNLHPNGGFLVLVENIDAVFASVVAAGGRITQAPQNASSGPGTRNGFLTDPDGTLIEVMQFIQRK